jgi:hypothetical protein
MKRFMSLLAIAALIVSTSLTVAMAQDKPAAGSAPAKMEEKKINCCNNGKLTQVGTEADCTKAGGKVVKDAKDCK